MKQFQSNALWPEGVFKNEYGQAITHDLHDTEEHAEACCQMLELEGFGGRKEHHPIKTWISEPQDPPRLPPFNQLDWYQIGKHVEMNIRELTK